MGQSAVRHTADYDSRQAYITKYTNNIYITTEEETFEITQTTQALPLVNAACTTAQSLWIISGSL